MKNILLILAFMVSAIMVTGCKKKEPAPEEAEPLTKVVEEAAKKVEETKEAAQEKLEEILQTTCPVMEGPIDKNIYTEYKGQKVYFCCQGCKETFENDPEKYLPKLPQFQTELQP